MVCLTVLVQCRRVTDGRTDGQTEGHTTLYSRDAMLARYLLSSCVRLSICLSVTGRHCTKTAKRMITQATSRTLVFGRQNLSEIPTG